MVNFVLEHLLEAMLVLIQEVPLLGSRCDPVNAVPNLVLERHQYVSFSRLKLKVYFSTGSNAGVTLRAPVSYKPTGVYFTLFCLPNNNCISTMLLLVILAALGTHHLAAV